MADTTSSVQASVTKTAAPKALEPPPRTTGNAVTDLPLLIDWFWRAYQVITQSVNYIRDRVDPTLDVVDDLPDPNGTTLAQAQATANAAYSQAQATKNLIAGWLFGTAAIADANVGVTINFDSSHQQADLNYTITPVVIDFDGTPTTDAFVVSTINYALDHFDIIMVGAPGVGNSVTVQWQLIRNT